MGSRRPGLWTPQGDVPLVGKDEVPLTREEIIVLSKLHELAHRHGWTLVCKSCDTSISGANANLSAGAAVACHCREFRYRPG